MLDLRLKKTRMIKMMSSFSKKYIFKMFSIHNKTPRRRFQFPRLKSVFWEALFNFLVEGKHFCRDKAVISNFSGVVWKILSHQMNIAHTTISLNINLITDFNYLSLSGGEGDDVTCKFR